jgi:diketogulonate reductase-like aldo/keto reductase
MLPTTQPVEQSGTHSTAEGGRANPPTPPGTPEKYRRHAHVDLAWHNDPMPNEFPSFVYGTAWKEDRTATLTELALRTGFRAIDTANQRKHYFEAGVGEALAAAYRAGFTTRDDLFLQTKFTYQQGQDHRLPYDPCAPLATQVAQSLASSLDHLRTDHVDSFVLHGPASNYEWTGSDSEVWEAMRKLRDEGHMRSLGLSNVTLQHLEQMKSVGLELPRSVQNRCFARLGWDREVRSFCSEHNIVYQGFSLLTANPEVVRHPAIAALARTLGTTPPQLIFCFSRAVGILPLTGSANAEHLQQDLASVHLALPPEVIAAIESIAG